MVNLPELAKYVASAALPNVTLGSSKLLLTKSNLNVGIKVLRVALYTAKPCGVFSVTLVDAIDVLIVEFPTITGMLYFFQNKHVFFARFLIYQVEVVVAFLYGPRPCCVVNVIALRPFIAELQVPSIDIGKPIGGAAQVAAIVKCGQYVTDY